MKKNILSSFIQVGLLVVLFIVNNSSVMATPIDLTETTGGFVSSDPTYVEFGPGLNQATLYEDDFFGVTYLSNNPELGDPGILIPLTASSITFDLDFYTSGSDSFEVLLLNSLGDVLFELFHDGSGMGPGSYQYSGVNIDLIALDLLGSVVGIEFSIDSGFGDTSYDAVLQISNADMDQNTSAVPEPSTIFLLGFGLMTIIFARRTQSILGG